MRWRSGRRSSNIEDRRRVRVSRKAAGGGIGIVVIALIAVYFGVDPGIFLSQVGPTSSVSTQHSTRPIPAAENELADTEDTWNGLFGQMGKQYQEPRLVLFSGAVQSDCFAGIWAHHADRARQILAKGDIEEALGAASAIGDDRLQRKSRGYVTPDSFTHGSSAQRVRWFKRGLTSGQVLDCNTFRADNL